MTCRHRLASATAVVVCASILVLPASAGASAGEASFKSLYPVASAFCVRVSAGLENKVLKRHASAVLADCASLQANYTSATSAVLAAKATLKPQIAANEQVVAAACPVPKHETPTCHSARVTHAPVLASLKLQLQTAVRAYYTSLGTARVSFWAAVSALPGGPRPPR
jgi:hypothetical protein